jgi:hypothetical protein
MIAASLSDVTKLLTICKLKIMVTRMMAYCCHNGARELRSLYTAIRYTLRDHFCNWGVL